VSAWATFAARLGVADFFGGLAGETSKDPGSAAERPGLAVLMKGQQAYASRAWSPPGLRACGPDGGCADVFAAREAHPDPGGGEVRLPYLQWVWAARASIALVMAARQLVPNWRSTIVTA